MKTAAKAAAVALAAGLALGAPSAALAAEEPAAPVVIDETNMSIDVRTDLTHDVALKPEGVQALDVPGSTHSGDEVEWLDAADLQDGTVHLYSATKPFAISDGSQWRAVMGLSAGDIVFIPEAAVLTSVQRPGYGADTAEAQKAKEAADTAASEKHAANFDGEGTLKEGAGFYATEDAAAEPSGTAGFKGLAARMSAAYEKGGTSWHKMDSPTESKTVVYVLAADVEGFQADEPEPTEGPTDEAPDESTNDAFGNPIGTQALAVPVQAAPAASVDDAPFTAGALIMMGALGAVTVGGLTLYYRVTTKRKEASDD